MTQVPPLPSEPVEGTCCITGAVGPCIPREHLIKPDTFCDQDKLRAPLSPLVSVDVWTAWRFGSRAEGKKKDMRPECNQSWWCDGREFRVLRRADVRELVLSGSPSTPWAMWVTTSYKKHGSLRAVVNTGQRGTVAFDEATVDCSDGAKVSEWWGRMNEFAHLGLGRGVQEQLVCPGWLMAKAGLRAWMEFEAWARPLYRTPLYALLCYLLPSKDEVRAS